MKKFSEMLVNEKSYDLSKFSDELAKMTDRNEHMAARLLMATLIDDKRLIEIVKACNNILDYEGHNAIYDYTNTLYSRMNEMGRKKYGEDWDKYIYPNT